MQQISEQLCFMCNIHITNDSNEIKGKVLRSTVKWKHDRCLEVLLNAGVDVNLADYSTLTPLMRAAEDGYVKSVKMFIQAGADVNRKNKEDETALMLAVLKGQEECVELLLNAGADVNFMSSSGGNNQFTALHAAVLSKNTKCLELLLKAGAYVNKEGKLF